ncbi:hypothetical protein CerSpe_262580 [Prunus speciosa]
MPFPISDSDFLHWALGDCFLLGLLLAWSMLLKFGPFADCNETLPSKLGSNLSEAARLWSASEIMVSKSSNAIFDPSSKLEY